jgi:ABC-2 type transport system permease protein
MIRVEFVKQFSRVKTRFILGLMVAFPVLLSLVFRLGQPQHQQGVSGTFIELSSLSGLNMAITVMAHVGPLILPVVAAVVAGGAVAEEAAWRTLGYLLMRPVGRDRLLGAKLIVVVAVIAAAVVLAALASVVAGLMAFGWGPVTVLSGGTISAFAGLSGIVAATLYIAWSVASLVCVAFLVSALSSSPLNAAAAGFGFYVVSQVLDSFSAMGDLRGLLPTHYWSAWQELIAASASWHGVLKGAVLQLPYAFVFLALAWWAFRRRDIFT